MNAHEPKSAVSPRVLAVTKFSDKDKKLCESGKLTCFRCKGRFDLFKAPVRQSVRAFFRIWMFDFFLSRTDAPNARTLCARNAASIFRIFSRYSQRKFKIRVFATNGKLP